MSTITIADLKNRLASKLHSTVINKLPDPYGLFYEAAGNYLVKTDAPDTIRTASLTNALYDQVYDYVAPTDLKDDAIIDIRPQTTREGGDNFNQVYGEEFDINKDNVSFAVRSNTGVKTLRISKSLEAGATVNELNSTTDNGTWAAGGNATNLVTDTFNKISGSGSLRFDISASGSTAYLENSTMSSVDLTDHLNVGALFVWIYIPATSITSVSLRWGSSSSDYWEVAAVTTTQDNTSFITGWNLLRFDWPATDTGTPDVTVVNYVRVTLNYDGSATTSCRVDNIVARIGSPYLLDYYSSYLFRNSSGTWIEKPTQDTDLVNLSVTSVNGYLYEVAQLAIQEIAGKDSSFDVDFWSKKIDEVWGKYVTGNKSERQKRRSTYYSQAARRRR